MMVGRGALADPWIFSGEIATAADAARFLLDYRDELLVNSPASLRGAAGRIKQLLRHWSAGGLALLDRESWMREGDPVRLFERLASLAGADREPRLNPVLSRKKKCRLEPTGGSAS
jgi:hypothetical protein